MLLLTLSGFYLFVLTIFSVGLRRGLKTGKPIDENKLPTVTVIVCARNEEGNIDRCLHSLSELHYPIGKLELIVVDDSSDDSTPQKLANWSSKLAHLRVVDLHGAPRFAAGKVNALIQGIDAATGEFICITDADCIVHPNWVSNYMQWYDDKTGMVTGITMLNSMKPFDAAQSCEMLQLLSLSMSAIEHGFPVSVIGNNLSIRKSAYEEIGGYRNIPFSVTEDIALFQAMWRSEWEVRFKANKELLIMSEPPGSFRTWWRQKQRWVVGGKAIEFPGKFILFVGYIGLVALLLAVFTLPTDEAFIAIGCKLVADLLILVPVTVSIRRVWLLLYFPLYELYLSFYLLCVPIQYFQKNIIWKGRDYRT